MQEKLIELLTQHTDVPASEITLESNLTTDLHMDSVELVALVMDWEDETGSVIEEDKLNGIHPVGDILKLFK